MGLKLRYNLFYDLKPGLIYQALVHYWKEEGERLMKREYERTGDWRSITSMGSKLYQPDGPWTLFEWSSGWEWVVRRQAQLYVSRVFERPGLLVFVDDGDYWGYELFNSGRYIDHFVQNRDAGADWFPGQDCRGNAELFAAQFPHLHLDVTKLASYLIQDPWLTEEEFNQAQAQGEEAFREKMYEADLESERLNVPANEGDEFTRFSECAVLDFLRFLGLHIELRAHYVTPLAPLWHDF